MSVLTDCNNINFEVYHRVLSQSVYALLSLIKVMLNVSTLNKNDQGKSWELVYGSVDQVLADHQIRRRIFTVTLLCCNFWRLLQNRNTIIIFNGTQKYGMVVQFGFKCTTLYS